MENFQYILQINKYRLSKHIFILIIYFARIFIVYCVFSRF